MNGSEEDLAGLERFLDSVSLRIRLFRIARYSSFAILAAAPLSAAAGSIAPESLGPAAVALALAPFAAAIAAAVFLARNRPASKREAAYLADEKLGLDGAVSALADQIGSDAGLPAIARALWSSIGHRIPSNASAVCRFRFPPSLIALFAVPPLLAASAAFLKPRPGVPPAPDLLSGISLKLLRAQRLIDREYPAGTADSAADELRRAAGRLAAGRDRRELAVETAKSLQAVEGRIRNLAEAISGLERAMGKDPDLEAISRMPDPASAKASEAVDRFAGKVSSGEMPEERRTGTASALMSAASNEQLGASLSESAAALAKAIIAQDAAGIRRSLPAVHSGARDLKRSLDRAEFAKTALKGAVIDLSGRKSGEDGTVPGSGDPTAGRDAGNAKPAAAAKDLPDRFEKAYLSAMENPAWDGKQDETVRRYFKAVWPSSNSPGK